MSNAICKVTVALEWFDPDDAARTFSEQFPTDEFECASKKPQRGLIFDVDTSDTALPLASVGAGALLFVKNLSLVSGNKCTIKSASGGTALAELNQGDPLQFFRVPVAHVAPHAIFSGAADQILIGAWIPV